VTEHGIQEDPFRHLSYGVAAVAVGLGFALVVTGSRFVLLPAAVVFGWTQVPSG
jgi:hypothetical protein